MSPLLLTGLFLFLAPFLLMVGFATYIFLGFVNDDKDAQAIFRIALVIMAVGLFCIAGYVVGSVVKFT